MIDWLLTHSPILYFTQSLWRDEVFSIFLAQQPLSVFLPKLSFEPPLYYILLHFWIKFFGTSEIAVRSLSLLGFSLSVIVIIHWAEKLFRTHWLSWGLPIMYFLNPMLLYYAFEVRTYGWYILFIVLSFYSYVEKKWILYLIATVLGFYTHSYMILVPFTQGIHFLFIFATKHKLKNISQKTIRLLLQERFIQASLLIVLSITPWLFRILKDASKLKESWYFPVDFHLIRSVLGNMFIGYEGTPWYLWGMTSLLSIVIVLYSVFAIKNKEHRTRNMFFFLSMYVPLIIVISISFVKPLFVNRYLIHVTIAQVFLLAIAIENVKKKMVQKILFGSTVIGLILFNIWYPAKHAKLDIRTTLMQINALKTRQDVVFAETPLIFFESVYYSSDPSRVFLYNPSNSPFPWYVGDIVFDKTRVARDFPEYPTRTFLIHENGAFDIAFQLPFSSMATKSRTNP